MSEVSSLVRRAMGEMLAVALVAINLGYFAHAWRHAKRAVWPASYGALVALSAICLVALLVLARRTMRRLGQASAASS